MKIGILFFMQYNKFSAILKESQLQLSHYQ